MARIGMFALLLAPLVCAGLSCSSSSDETRSVTLGLGAFCDTGFPGDCPGGMCRDAVGGESCDGGTCTDWSQSGNQGTICTKGCSNDSDCTGINFAGAIQEQVSSEEWFCSGGVCNALVTAPAGQATDVCTGCGGIFCSGRCIGCPQC